MTPLAPSKWFDAEYAARSWAMEKGSSAVAQTIGALSQFGLLKVEGRGEHRHLALSALAHRILQSDERGDSDALRRAALAPKIFAKLWQVLQLSAKVDRVMLIRFLTTERATPFGPRAAEEVLRLFGETAAYTGLSLRGAEGEGPLHNEVFDPVAPQRPELEEVLAGGRIRIQFREKPSAG